MAAFLRPHGPPARILRLILQGQVEVSVNEAILAEYLEVLVWPKFRLARKHVGSGS